MGRVLLKVSILSMPPLANVLTLYLGYNFGRQRVRQYLRDSAPDTTSPHSVGKTSLMNQYVNKRFSNQYKATIGADLCVDRPLYGYCVDFA
jgi:hypothetical protein